MGAGLEPQHAQVIGQNHPAIGGQKRGALCLGASEPVGSGLIRARVAGMLDQKHQRVGMVTDRAGLAARGIEDIGIDRVDPGGKGFRAALLKFLFQVVDQRVAIGRGQEMFGPQRRHTDHRGIEIIPRRLQVMRALDRVVGDLGGAMGDGAVAHRVEHGHEARHRMGQRQRIGMGKGQGALFGHLPQIDRPRPARQPFKGERPQMDRPVLIGKDAHSGAS